MNGTNLEDKILKAIDIIVSKKVSEAGYDKTIQGVIVSCSDPTIGKYKIRYQDSFFYAFATNMEVTYTKGSSVYILVPKGDFRQQKTILGAVEKLGINYIAVAERDEAYIQSGQNCIKDNGKQIAISSYLQNLAHNSKYLKVIYSHNGGSKNLINIDTTRFQEYIKTSSSLICGSTIRTNFNAQQKERGNYGIIFRLSFKDNNTGASIIRSFLLDINKMTGNPYNYNQPLRQYAIFNDVDGKNFIRIEDISLFCYGFPNQTKTEKTITNNLLDIFFSKFELIACNKMTQEESSKYALVLQPSKIVFVNDQDAATKTIQAEVRIKGKAADAAQKIKYYWFVEDSSVVTDSPFYCQYGGRGWRCLNEKNTLQQEVKNNQGNIIKPAVYEWKAAGNSLAVKNADVLVKSLKYKCVAIFDNTPIAKQFEAKKLNGVDLSIVSDSGVEFYYDLGSPTLTCLVNGKENPNNYIYEWSVLRADGYFNKVVQDVNKDAYNKAKAEYQKAVQLRDLLADGLARNTVLKTSGEKQLVQLQKDVTDKLKKLESLAVSELKGSVYKNKIFNIPINTVINYNIYKCAVWTAKNNKYVGTASLQIRNILDKKQGYSLVINDSTQSFKYNEKGVAPTSSSLNNPYTLKPLSFTIYDEFGREAISSTSTDQKVLQQQLSLIKWEIPSVNSMLLPPSKGTIQNENYIFSGKTLNYKIQPSYNISYKRNNVSLTINYKDNILKAQTNFTFVKEGEPGTNGTAYSCKIEPYVKTGTKIPFYPTIYLDLDNTEYKFRDDDAHFNFTCAKHNGQWFRIKFFHNDELIYSSDGTKNNSQISIKWSIVANKYDNSHKDNMALNVTQSTGVFSVNTAAFKDKHAPACTIKAEVTYNGITEYAYLPVIFSINRANYKINLNDYTGFNLVVYTGDGRKPSYDNASPHTLTVTQKINNVNQDITNNQSKYKLSYAWSLLGSSCWSNPAAAINAIQNNKNLTAQQKKERLEDLKVKNYGSKLVWNDNAMLLKKLSSSNNKCTCQPIDDFSNLCVTNSVKCIVSQGTNQIGFIIIPIHMMLNQYGNAKINGWDGNSIDIDDDGGVVLAPQVGAGRKEPDNTFTGVLMGQVKQNDSGLSKTYNGLLGFSKGRRSIYLDADTGRAYFGVAGQGQIELIPDGDSTIGGWVIGQTTLHSKGKEKFGDNKVGGLLQNSGKIDFTSDKGNYLRYDGTDFYLNGGTITGGSIDIGSSFFTADAERIDFGSFMITESYGRDALTVEGNSMAISANVYNTGGWWMWFSLYGDDVSQGDNDPADYAMVLNDGGQLYAQDHLYVDGGDVVSVRDQINSIWGQIDALWSAIESLGDEDEDD